MTLTRIVTAILGPTDDDTIDELRLALTAERQAHAASRGALEASRRTQALAESRLDAAQRGREVAEHRALVAAAQLEPLARAVIAMLEERRREFAAGERQLVHREYEALAREAL